MDKQMELLQGTLDMLILKAVSLGPLHGYGILLRIQQISKDRLEILQGSLYPALYRLEHQGWIASEWGESENNRRAKYYRLTAAGSAGCTRKPKTGTAWPTSSREFWGLSRRKCDALAPVSVVVADNSPPFADGKGDGRGVALSYRDTRRRLDAGWDYARRGYAARSH